MPAPWGPSGHASGAARPRDETPCLTLSANKRHPTGAEGHTCWVVGPFGRGPGPAPPLAAERVGEPAGIGGEHVFFGQLAETEPSESMKIPGRTTGAQSATTIQRC